MVQLSNQSALRELRTDGQPPDIDCITCPELGIPGVQHQLPNDANITTSTEDEENPTGFQSITGSAISISSSDGPVCGQDNSYPVSPINSSSVLQGSAVSDELGCSSQLYPGRDNRQVQHHSTTGPREHSRSNMVELTEQEGFINPCYTTSTISDHIESDASNKGWDTVLEGQTRTRGVWTAEEAAHHINYLELLAAFLAIKVFEKDWRDTAVLLHMDNITAVPYVNHKLQGRYSLTQTIQTSHHNVDLVHFLEHHIDSRIPSRPTQCDSRPGIVVGQGLL